MREKSTQWWWIRHAPVPDMEGILYGSQDVACDTTNLRAFQWLAKILPNNGIWLTSHLSRTQKTAEAIRQAGLNFSEPIKESKIGEQNFGDWQGLTWREMKERDPILYKAFWEKPARNSPPNGESFKDQVERVSDVINNLNQIYKEKCIIAVAHAGSIRAALVHALEVSPEVGMSFSIDNLSVTRMEYVEGGLLRGKGGGCRLVFTNRNADDFI